MAQLTDPAAFLRLVGKGRIDAARQALAESPGLVNAIGPHPFWGGRPQALHVAVETKQQEMFALLLEAGANVDGDNGEYEQWSPLMLAADKSAMRDELLRRGARIGVPEALLLGDDAKLAELLRPGATALPVLVPGSGSLLNFARTPYAVDRLLELGVSTAAPDRWGNTPAMAISRLGERGVPLIRRLIEHGVAVDPEQHARLGDAVAIQALGAEIAQRYSVLFAAVESGNRDLVRWLLAHGASPNARSKDRSRQTALHSAAWSADLEMAKLLVEAGADPTARDEEHGGTPADWAEVSLTVTRNPACQPVRDYLVAISREPSAGDS